MTFARYDATGTPETLLVSPPIEGAAYLGARDGYVGFGLLVREPATKAQLILLRLDDGLTSAVQIQEGVDDIVALGWAP